MKEEVELEEAARVARKPGQPAQSDKHSDLYTDENPKGTIQGLKFATVDDAKRSVKKIKTSGRSHAHKIQAAIAMEQRARVMGKTEVADVYRSFINLMKEKTKEMNETLDESSETGLAAKAKKSGISIGTLRKVYRRGVAAWNSGHRPGTNPQQWGMARVNSYITKGKGTYYGADKDLREQEEMTDAQMKKREEIVKSMKKDKAGFKDRYGDRAKTVMYATATKMAMKEDSVPKDKASGLPKKYVAGLSASTAKARAAHWNKMNKKSDSDPSAYEPAPGDATVKTKPSKHTLKYKEMFGEESNKEILEKCWDGYKSVGLKKKGNKMVPNCVPEAVSPAQQAAIAIAMKKVGKKPNKNHSSSRLEGTKSLSDIYKKDTPGQNEEVSLAQQAAIVISMKKLVEYAVDSKGHKSSTGGLTQKGRDYFNSKFGGNLRAPVTTPPSKLDPKSKAAKRRKSFCARMSGVKGPMKKPNGDPTRKALALRKWNC